MNKLYEIVAETFDIETDEIDDAKGPDDIESWDSLGQLRLISAIENHYLITFEFGEMFEIMTIGDIKRILVKKGVI